MCVCPRLCVASHVVWSILYIVVGAIQLIAGIFFFISLPVFKIGSNIWTGVWNVVAGVGGAVFSCVGDLNPNKQQVLLYLTISVLVINVINLVVLELGEWRILMPDTVKAVIEKENLQTLVFYARMTTSISTGVAVVTSFFDAQFMFCWLEHNLRPRNRLDHNETVSDIEYIIPRVKSGSNNGQGETGRNANNSHAVYNQYAQSWVFDTDTIGSCQSDSPYSKLQQFNGSKTVILKRKTKRPDCEQISNNIATKTKSKSQPMVLVEDTTKNNNNNNNTNSNNNNTDTDNERKLQFMASFSRTPSPVAGGHNSDSSSPASNPPMIYECLERLTEPSVYRSRLNTALVINAERTPPCVSPRPHSIVISDQVQYASLMVELEKTIVAKFPTHRTPDNRSETVTRHSSRRASSRDDSTFHPQNITNQLSSSQMNQSDTDFSKELEAALQLIQDLESPITAETPSDHPAMLSSSSYQHHNISSTDDDHRTPRCLISQLTERSIDLDNESFESGDGKQYYCHLHHSYCTDCYNKPQQISTFKSQNGHILNGVYHVANNYKDNCQSLLEVNHSFISSQENVNITEKSERTWEIGFPNEDEDESCNVALEKNVNNNLLKTCNSYSNGKNSNSNNLSSNSNNNNNSNYNNCSNDSSALSDKIQEEIVQIEDDKSTIFVKLKSMFKHKRSSPVKEKKITLIPELERSILKSESLVHLSEVELVQRYNRNKNIHRKIEERVSQRINGASSSDTFC